ncbi:uroporphyrinogen-III synthase [Microvirga massiliensis]|uniref:uroporphyrinogen-III synthase n=1 Tax=Microvirga massiliensis TaxID=1033741 RepID=UPI00062BF005|nr:uroporphyrinogen-III synthase [Microvirga massiliensis]
MRILVTRSRDDAERTAERLRERGHEPILAPVLEIAPTGTTPPVESPAALILTSGHAVAPAAAALPKQVPVFAVGERTARAARQAGFTAVATAGGDAQALVRLVAERIAPGARLLHTRGRDAKPEPEASLSAHGFAVRPWIAYDARPAGALPAEAVEAIRAGAIEAVLHYSRRSAEILLALAADAQLDACLPRMRHACLSADVAQPLTLAGLDVVVAEAPNEDRLLALLGP